MKSYSPQEELVVSLGVDPAIRIDYKPIRKFKGQSGILAKTTITVYSQVNNLFISICCIYLQKNVIKNFKWKQGYRNQEHNNKHGQTSFAG